MGTPKNGAYCRRKGHAAEQEYAKRFREMGYEFCKTTREGSRMLDACGIDLYGIPLNAQIKCGFKKQRPNAEALFKKMKEDMKKHIPPGESYHILPKILIHKSQGYTEEGELVTMTWKDFVPFLEAYKKYNDDRSGIQST